MELFDLFSLVDNEKEEVKGNTQNKENDDLKASNDVKIEATVEESIEKSSAELFEELYVGPNEESVSTSVDDLIVESVSTSVDDLIVESVSTSVDESVEELDPFSLFEDLSAKADEAEAKREAALTKAKNKKDKKNDTKKVEATSIESGVIPVNEETKIHIYHEVYNITDFFSIEEITNGVAIKKADESFENKPITTEMVRARIAANGYPHFVEGFTQCVYHKEQNMIVPVAIAKKKGCDTKVEVKSSDTDGFTSFLKKTEQKIPFKLFSQFVALAKMFTKLKLEVRGEYYYNHTTKEFILHLPQQTVHRYWVISDEQPGQFQMEMLNKGQVVELVCEIHSHHSMPAIPSATDDESERMPLMTYVIVGELDKHIFNAYARTFDGNKYIQLKLADIFAPEIDSTDLEFNNLPKFKASQVTVVR